MITLERDKDYYLDYSLVYLDIHRLRIDEEKGVCLGDGR
jgi:hypothetical protein